MKYFYHRRADICQCLRDCFFSWNSYLKDEGILQLPYLYSFCYQDFLNNQGIAVYDLVQVYKALRGYPLDIEWIDGVCGNSKDAIVTYTKKLVK